MDTNMKVVREALLSRNWFDENSLKILNDATDLDKIVIQIEKSFNCDHYDFQYNSIKRKFIRLGKREGKGLNTMYSTNEKCMKCSVKCYRSAYSITEFIELCKGVFEPISVRLA